MGNRIKQGDTVKVIAGRESGKTGEVERVREYERRHRARKTLLRSLDARLGG